jgi:hypothetical protein
MLIGCFKGGSMKVWWWTILVRFIWINRSKSCEGAWKSKVHCQKPVLDEPTNHVERYFSVMLVSCLKNGLF